MGRTEKTMSGHTELRAGHQAVVSSHTHPELRGLGLRNHAFPVTGQPILGSVNRGR